MAEDSRSSTEASGRLAGAPTTANVCRVVAGTYVRTHALDTLVLRFLRQKPGEAKQIVSLGAGSDTRYFRLKARHPGLATNLQYHEVDFAENTAAKIAAIRRNGPLMDALVGPSTKGAEQASRHDALRLSEGDTRLETANYTITPLDLRKLANPSHTSALSFPLRVNQSLPTLVLSEMVLCYLDAKTSSSILSNLGRHLSFPRTPWGLLIYEPIKPDDAFGRMMIRNLEARGIHLPSLQDYPDLDSQIRRMKDVGFGGNGDEAELCGSEAMTVDQIYDSNVWIPEEERERVEGLEWLDEIEEWKMLAGHYAVVWGWREEANDGVFSKAWAGLANG